MKARSSTRTTSVALMSLRLKPLALSCALVLALATGARGDSPPPAEDLRLAAQTEFAQAAISAYKLALWSRIAAIHPNRVDIGSGTIEFTSGGFSWTGGRGMGIGELPPIYPVIISELRSAQREHKARGWSLFLDSRRPPSPAWDSRRDPLSAALSPQDFTSVDDQLFALHATYLRFPPLGRIADLVEQARADARTGLNAAMDAQASGMPSEFPQRYRWWKKSHLDFKVGLCVPSGGSDYSAGIGANVGMSYNRRLSHKLELCNEALFSIRSLGIDNFDIDIREARELDLYSVDFIPSVKFALGHYLDNHFYLLGGIEMRKLISAKVVAGKGYGGGDAQETEDIDVTDKVDAMAYGITVGVGFVRQTQRGWFLKGDLK